MLSTNSGYLNSQVFDAAIREWNGAVFVALALSHVKLSSVEVDVLHSQATAFEQPQSGAIRQLDHQSVDTAAPFDVLDQSGHFLPGQNNWQAAAALP